MITDDDVKKLKKVFATKKDLDKFATKDDLKKTTTELQVEIFKTREELKSEINLLEERFDKKFDRVMNGVDKVVVELQAMRQEQSIHRLEHDDIEKKFKAIESTSTVAHNVK